MQFELLTVAGFGPYAETQTIDFTKLAGQGLFSVSGVTGAGKTSIFDALTYAIYGELPGTREAAGIRSHHVGPNDPTRVELVFTAANDRWRVIRSPEYMRAKIRSTGLTKEPAKVALYRWVAGTWEPHEGSLREVNPKLRDLTGLDRGQFERVGLLPQGEFRRLLHAPSSKRRELFRSLFGTGAINVAVAALKSNAAEARRVAETAEAVQTVRAQEATSLTDQLKTFSVPSSHGQLSILPTVPVAPADEPAPDPTQDLQNAADQVELVILPILNQAESMATEVAAAAGNALQTAQDKIELIRRRTSLAAAKARLEQERPAAESAGVDAERARRAQPVVAVHRRWTADEDRLGNAGTEFRNAQENLATAFATAGIPVPEEIGVRNLQSIVDEQIHRFKALAEHQNHKTELSKRRSATVGRLNALQAEVTSLAKEEQEIDSRLALLTAQHAEAREAATLIPSQTAALTDLEGVVRAAIQRDEASRAITATETQLATAQKGLQDAAAEHASLAHSLAETQQIAALLSERRTALTEATRRFRAASDRDAVKSDLEQASHKLATATEDQAALTERFTAEVAPRLAQALIPGEPCTVCGATEHPHPATSSVVNGSGVTDAALAGAQDRTAEALIAVTRLRERSLLLAESAGTVTFDEAETCLKDAEAALQEVTQAMESVPGQEQALRQLHAGITEVKKKIDSLSAAAEEQRTSQIAAVAKLGSRGMTSASDLQNRLAEARSALAQIEKQAAATDSLQSAIHELVTHKGSVHADFLHASTRIAAEQSAIGEIEKQIAVCQAHLAPVGDLDPAEMLAHSIAAKSCLSAVEDTTEQLGKARELASRSSAELQTVLKASGFPTLQEAQEAERTQQECATLNELVSHFNDRWSQCEADLAALDKLDIPEDEPDILQLTAQAHNAAAAATAATAERVLVQKCLRDARSMIAKLTTEGTKLAAVLVEADRRERIANLCDAKGASKIGLEGFILRSYLQQVVHQANLRLRSLSSGRYQLVLEDEAIDGRGEWGLDLTISDSHTGEKRGVKSLSGGETFYTSLALALGLSDVLSSNGSTAISSVFIDEGFGSLDQDVIDLTVEVLSQLRHDGVTVGVITHVEAVRDALPLGLTVEKIPSGASRVVQHA